MLVPILRDAIKTAKIPDINQRVDTPIGHIHFRLYKFVTLLSFINLTLDAVLHRN